MIRLIKEYKLELIAVGLIFIGVFLILDRYVRGLVIGAINQIIQVLLQIFDRVGTTLSDRLARLSPAEFAGGVLIMVATGLLVWRIRHRFRTGRQWGGISCPKCSSPIQRVHRHGWDRVLGITFMPEARRYRCVNPDCLWSGLRRRNILPHHHHTEEEPSPLPSPLP